MGVWRRSTRKLKITPEGGVAIRLINNTGAPTVKGYCVTSSDTLDNAVQLVPIDEPDCFGVLYDTGIASGLEAWVVISGIADVYFIGNTTRKHLARTFISSDVGAISGQAISEPIPIAPFATDKHFCEIGHVLESRVGAGLAKTVLHFN